jgi:hydroxymethylglutaryl-CoA reductase
MRAGLDMPALTEAEAGVVDHYLAAVDCLGRINPTRAEHTYRALLAAQALASHATALRDSLALMFERGEIEIHGEILARAMRVLDAQRRVGRVAIPDPGPPQP